jgi:hypothetical protein
MASPEHRNRPNHRLRAKKSGVPMSVMAEYVAVSEGDLLLQSRTRPLAPSPASEEGLQKGTTLGGSAPVSLRAVRGEACALPTRMQETSNVSGHGRHRLARMSASAWVHKDTRTYRGGAVSAGSGSMRTWRGRSTRGHCVRGPRLWACTDKPAEQLVRHIDSCVGTQRAAARSSLCNVAIGNEAVGVARARVRDQQPPEESLAPQQATAAKKSAS